MENQKDVEGCLYETTFKKDVRMFISILGGTDTEDNTVGFRAGFIGVLTNQRTKRQEDVLSSAICQVHDNYFDGCNFILKLMENNIDFNDANIGWKQRLIKQLQKLVEPTLQDVYDNYKGNRLDKLKVYAEYLYSITPVQQRAELIETLKRVTDEDLKHVCATFEDVVENLTDKVAQMSIKRFYEVGDYYERCTDKDDRVLCFGTKYFNSLTIPPITLQQYKITPVQIGNVKGYIFPVNTN